MKNLKQFDEAMANAFAGCDFGPDGTTMPMYREMYLEDMTGYAVEVFMIVDAEGIAVTGAEHDFQLWKPTRIYEDALALADSFNERIDLRALYAAGFTQTT